MGKSQLVSGRANSLAVDDHNPCQRQLDSPVDVTSRRIQAPSRRRLGRIKGEGGGYDLADNPRCIDRGRGFRARAQAR